jgi:uncharacterized RDD family membrane protein YckC
MTARPGEDPTVATPSLARRMASFLYEGMLLFGIGLIPGVLGALFMALTGKPPTSQSDTVLRALAFAIFGAYFVYFWSTRGQTLPMQTWRIRVVGPDGRPPSRMRALVRYLASCLWFAPAALIAELNGWTRWPSLAAVGVGIVVWALAALVHPRRQFWHDALSGTRLVSAFPGAPR